MWQSVLIAVLAYVSMCMAVIYAARHESEKALYSLVMNVGPVVLVIGSFALQRSLHDLFVTARVMEVGPMILYYQATVLGAMSAVIYVVYDDYRYRSARETSCEKVE